MKTEEFENKIVKLHHIFKNLLCLNSPHTLALNILCSYLDLDHAHSKIYILADIYITFSGINISP